MPPHFTLPLFEFLECFPPYPFMVLPVPCQNQNPAQSLSRNRNSHSWQLLKFHTSWSEMLFPKPRVLNVFSLQKKPKQTNKTTVLLFRLPRLFFKSIWEMKSFKTQVQVLSCISLLFLYNSNSQTFSSMFCFSWSLSNSVIALCRLPQHLPSTRPGPYHRKDGCLEAPLLVSEVFSNLHRFQFINLDHFQKEEQWISNSELMRSTKHSALNNWNYQT